MNRRENLKLLFTGSIGHRITFDAIVLRAQKIHLHLP